MGLFSSKPKKTLLEVIGIDLTQYPDDSFMTEEEINESGTKITNHISYFGEGYFLNLFSKLRVVTFENSMAKNFIFSCPVYDGINKSSLSHLVDSIFDIYGKDSSGNGRFTSDDWNDIKDEEYWSGRMYTDDKYATACMLSYDNEEGLGFTIWLT